MVKPSPEVALRTLVSDVVDDLQRAGWRERSHGRPWTDLSSVRSNGLVATLSVIVHVTEWPVVSVLINAGVTHGDAAALGSALTLHERAWQLAGRPGGAKHDFATLDQVEQARLTRLFESDAARLTSDFADGFDDAEALLAYLAPATDSSTATRALALTNCFLLAGAIGPLSRAESLLAQLEQLPASASSGKTFRRFLRQARRWVDAGGPMVPPLSASGPEPERARPPRHLKRTALRMMRDADARRDARLRLIREMRQVPRPGTIELRRSLEEDLRAHGIVEAPTAVAVQVDRLQRRRGLLGPARSARCTAALWWELGGRLGTGIRSRRLPSAPTWAERPERASFSYEAARNSWAEVDLAPDSGDFLHDFVRANERRLGNHHYVSVWLDQPPGAGAAVRVYIGLRQVGSVTGEAALAFAEVLAAAAAMEESVATPGMFIFITPPVLCIPLPADDAATRPYG